MNRKILITLITILITLILVFLLFFWLPAGYKSSIKVNNHEVNIYKSDKVKFKVLVFSDLALGYDYQVSNLEYLVKKINEQEPDVVVFNGDLIDSEKYNEKDNTKVIKYLKQIKAIYGKFSVLGEMDTKTSKNLLVEGGFEQLNNTTREININENKFNLVSLSSKGYSKPLSILSDDTFNFVATHNPIIIDDIIKNKIDIIVSGHTLGGQYNLPFYGTIFSEIKNIPYYKGQYEINGIKIYSSNGIGTRYSNMRLLAPSSIEIFNFK